MGLSLIFRIAYTMYIVICVAMMRQNGKKLRNKKTPLAKLHNGNMKPLKFHT